MKTLQMGLGAVAGAVITLAMVNCMYPDVPKRMVRDGRRMIRSARRTVCDLSELMSD